MLRFPVVSLLALPFFVLLPSFSSAQQGAALSQQSGMPPRMGSDAAIISLLQQSHDINQQLPFRAQTSLLQTQIRMVSEVRPDLGREWASELFSLSSQAKGAERSHLQDNAMAILAHLDPDRALELLHQMDLSDSDASGSYPMMAHSQLIQQVFQVLARRDGEAALPVLEREAAFIGSAGPYPYFALGSAAAEITSKDWAKNKEHTIQAEQSVIDVAFTRYRQTPHNYLDDVDFGQMLQPLAGTLPFESVQPALHALVTNLLATDASKYRYHAQIYASDGQSVKTDDPIDAALLEFGRLITRDPDLVQQLESSRPQLQTGLELAKSGQIRSMTFGGTLVSSRTPPPPRTDANAETEIDALRLAHINPEVALAKAEQLPAGPDRASTLLEIARAIAANHPEEATNLIAQAKTEAQANPQLQVGVISAQAFLAAAQNNQSQLRDLLQQGFATANQYLLGGQNKFVSSPGPLVQIGIQNEPDLTTTFLQGLPASQFKAQLLIEAAAALSMRRRLPLDSPQQPKPAISN